MNHTPLSTTLADAAPIAVVHTRDELSAALAAARRAGKSVGLVPTMGALHAGHISLVDAARAECDFVVVTIFVNPTQFGPGEDFTKYPRTLEADLAALAGHGADLVFAPTQQGIYRPGHTSYVEVGRVAEPMEGVCRPGHFRGVATVVLKLFNLIPADRAYFGQKDYQQTLVIRQLVRDFDLPVEIRVAPIVREADGLALSSRNVYLSPEERRRALVLSQSLALAAQWVAAGETSAETIRKRIVEHLQSVSGVQIEYVALVREGTVEAVDEVTEPTVVAIAARVGSTRLIDNRVIGAERK